jgi:hypothetical protein
MTVMPATLPLLSVPEIITSMAAEISGLSASGAYFSLCRVIPLWYSEIASPRPVGSLLCRIFQSSLLPAIAKKKP